MVHRSIILVAFSCILGQCRTSSEVIDRRSDEPIAPPSQVTAERLMLNGNEFYSLTYPNHNPKALTSYQVCNQTTCFYRGLAPSGTVDIPQLPPGDHTVSLRSCLSPTACSPTVTVPLQAKISPASDPELAAALVAQNKVEQELTVISAELYQLAAQFRGALGICPMRDASLLKLQERLDGILALGPGGVALKGTQYTADELVAWEKRDQATVASESASAADAVADKKGPDIIEIAFELPLVLLGAGGFYIEISQMRSWWRYLDKQRTGIFNGVEVKLVRTKSGLLEIKGRPGVRFFEDPYTRKVLRDANNHFQAVDFDPDALGLRYSLRNRNWIDRSGKAVRFPRDPDTGKIVVTVAAPNAANVNNAGVVKGRFDWSQSPFHEVKGNLLVRKPKTPVVKDNYDDLVDGLRRHPYDPASGGDEFVRRFGPVGRAAVLIGSALAIGAGLVSLIRAAQGQNLAANKDGSGCTGPKMQALAAAFDAKLTKWGEKRFERYLVLKKIDGML